MMEVNSPMGVLVVDSKKKYTRIKDDDISVLQLNGIFYFLRVL